MRVLPQECAQSLPHLLLNVCGPKSQHSPQEAEYLILHLAVIKPTQPDESSQGHDGGPVQSKHAGFVLCLGRADVQPVVECVEHRLLVPGALVKGPGGLSCVS